MLHSAKCQIFSSKSDAQLQTLFETLVQTYTYANLTKPNLCRVKKGRAGSF